ncbi:hypothetical protein AWRI1631_10290 [Saccharomyces cerevisiae AWRI1631]|uniref:Uncharacterized protein n=1 Tax=Saccharomyces cerevisiae (strain AWRI1631) TaxID=545124 RepID=B5VDI8_YEAS6|nr:hypothetical protein AWRI1631_10290 [Saccharomyces cerevisiae AWRI1631]
MITRSQSSRWHRIIPVDVLFEKYFNCKRELHFADP